jgi:hypothetical protein
VRPDAIDYAASVPKIAILLAWMQTHPEAATTLDATTRRELGKMIKVSDNELATKFSTQLGIARVQEVLGSYGFYDAAHGGGLWFGKHYGKGSERVGDPVGGHSHAATVRQLLRFYLLLEQGKLVSPAASAVMREIFASPEIAHLNDRFVKGLAGRGVEVRRKSGWWETWSHDTAVVTGPGRHYVLVAMTSPPERRRLPRRIRGGGGRRADGHSRLERSPAKWTALRLRGNAASPDMSLVISHRIRAREFGAEIPADAKEANHAVDGERAAGRHSTTESLRHFGAWTPPHRILAGGGGRHAVSPLLP